MANRYFLNIGVNYNATANWSATSGGAGGASVPTNADDVFFDANSGNCTVNVASVAKSVNFTGYTNTITMTNTLTVSGSVTLVAAMTIAGSSGLSINATGTFTSNGKTWPNALTFGGSITITLADDLNISGSLGIGGGNTTINGSFNINASGGFGLGTGSSIVKGTGTPVLNLLGGTWTASGNTSYIIIDTNINGNITISGTVYYGTYTLKYISGTVSFINNSTLNIGITGSANLDTSGMSWNNVNFSHTSTTTLISNLNINGLLTTSGVSGYTVTINGSFNINCNGGITITEIVTGTSTLRLLGGTWSGSGQLRLNTNINGNITISVTVNYNTGTLTYTSGTVTTTGSTLISGSSATFNTSGMSWNNVTLVNPTFTSDFNINGNLTGGITTYNGTYNVNVYGNITVSNYIQQGTGVTTINMLGNGSIDIVQLLNIQFNINGNYTIIALNSFGGNAIPTFTYINGKVIVKAILVSFGLCKLINIDKINFRTISITATVTLTMNKFFSGSALIPTRIQSTTAGSNYTIAFQDGFEKITKFTKISNCTVSRPGQLLCITDKSNKGGNVGVRYINQMPNGIAKNAASVSNPLGYSVPTFLEADPNFIVN